MLVFSRSVNMLRRIDTEYRGGGEGNLDLEGEAHVGLDFHRLLLQ